jgi:DNA-binding MarR family transcriptional regulator
MEVAPEDQPIDQLLRTAGQLAALYWLRQVERAGLSPAGFAVLEQLEALDESAGDVGLSPQRLARGSWVSPTTMAGVLETLEGDGLVRWRTDRADRRRNQLYLTPLGRHRLAEARAAVGDVYAGRWEHLDPADERVVRRFLIDAVRVFDAVPDRDPVTGGSVNGGSGSR